MIDTSLAVPRGSSVRPKDRWGMQAVAACFIALLMVSFAFGQKADEAKPNKEPQNQPGNENRSDESHKAKGESNGFGLSDLMAFASLIVSAVTFFYAHHQTKTARAQYAQSLMARIYEFNQGVVEHPQIQRFLYERATDQTPFFVATTPHNDLYFQVKSAIYSQLNFFDELYHAIIFDASLSQTLEQEAWEQYIIHKLRHPLYKELFLQQRHHWGEAFNRFIDARRSEIDKPMTAEDREMY